MDTNVEKYEGVAYLRKMRIWSRKMISLIKYDCVHKDTVILISLGKVIGGQLLCKHPLTFKKHIYRKWFYDSIFVCEL